MTVNLKWVLILSMVLAVLGFLVGAGSQFTDLGLTAAETKAVIAGFVILLGVGNACNSVLVAFGMNTPSRLSGASQIDGVKGFQVSPALVKMATAAVDGNATITSTGK